VIDAFPEGTLNCAVVYSPESTIYGEPINRNLAYSHPILGEAEGESLGDTDGDTLGDADGETLGDFDGDKLGDNDAEGERLGEADGDFEGDRLGETEGDLLGDADGELDGDLLGDADGLLLGEDDGEALADGVSRANDPVAAPLCSVPATAIME